MEYISSDYRGIARDKLKGGWWIALLATLVAGILGGSNGGTDLRLNASAFRERLSDVYEHANLPTPELLTALNAIWPTIATVSLFYVVIMLIVGSAVQLGHNMFYIDLCNNRGASFSTLFSRFSILGKAVGQRLYMALFTFLWSLLFVIPGIVAAYRYALAPYILAQNPHMSAIDAVQESKELMLGHKWRLFCLDLSFIGWWFLSILTLGIGLLWLNPYRCAARAAFYLDRTGQGELLNTPDFS